MFANANTMRILYIAKITKSVSMQSREFHIDMLIIFFKERVKWEGTKIRRQTFKYLFQV